MKHTARPIFFAIVESVILANGLSAPQHSTYFVILEDGRDLVGTPPGVAEKNINKSKTQNPIKQKIKTGWCINSPIPIIGDLIPAGKPSPFAMDIFLPSDIIAPDERRLSANAIKP